MTRRLRLGIIGADADGKGWAPLAHLPALRVLPEYELTAVCTTRPESAAAAAARYGIPRAFHDVNELVAQPDIDVVSVVVRAPNHHAVVMPALAAGKHVYCEWPLGANSTEAAEMASLARERGVRAVIGLQARADPALRHVRDLVREGHVGDVVAVNMVMLTAGALEHPQSRAWERDPKQGVSALTIRGIHSLDALCFCLGELEELSARVSTQVRQWRITETGETVDTEAPDNVIVAARLANGAAVSAHIATLPFRTPGFRMEIFGRHGTLEVSTRGAPQRDANVIRGSQRGAPLAPIAVPAHYIEVPPETPSGPPHNVAHLYRRLAHAIADGTSVEPDFDTALARHRLIDAIQRSSDEGRSVAVRQ